MNENTFIQYRSETERPVLKIILILAGIAFIFNIGLSLTGYYNWNFDSWTHMFFASHYMNSWFDTWEPRWFTGFSVTSYPPLITQLLAVLGFMFGLEKAYILLSLTGMVLLPIAVYLFCYNLLPTKGAAWAGFLAIFLPSIYMTNYFWGQLPCLLASVTTLLMSYFLGRFLECGRFKQALIGALFLGVTAASHHQTFICFVPLIILLTILNRIYLNQKNLKTIALRTLAFVSVSLPFAILPTFPFWKFALTTNIQTEIFHATRTNLFSDSMVFLQWVLALYFLLLLVIPFLPLVAIRYKRLIPLVIIAVFLFVLGLGGTTPLPKWIFGDWWKWLTYERYAIWASLLLVPLAVSILSLRDMPLSINSFKTPWRWLLFVAIFAMCIASSFLGTEPVRKTYYPSPPQVDVKALAEILEREDIGVGSEYYYVTLGFGEAQFEKLSTLTSAKSLDGTYYTARTLPVLRESGIASVDASKHFDPENNTLRTILKDAPQYHLKLVLVNDVFYNEVLEENGFVLRWSAQNLYDNRLGGVTIWERNDIPLITAEEKNETGFWSHIWGIAPLSMLVALLVILLVEIKPVSPKQQKPKNSS